jgi:hypothetical protein
MGYYYYKGLKIVGELWEGGLEEWSSQQEN